MQVYPILLIAVLIAADAGMTAFGAGGDTSNALAACAALIPMAVMLALGALVVHMSMARAGSDPRRAVRALRTADLVARATRVLVILNHVIAVLVFGWLSAVRDVVGNLVLVDELIAIIPPVVGLLGSWWVFYPAERLMRDALLVRRLDQGMPVYSLPSRRQYVLLQARLQLVIILVPVLLITGLAEMVNFALVKFGVDRIGSALMWIDQGAKLVAAALVFMLAPLLARLLLDVQPLPASPLRDDLLAVCRRHRMGVRRILLWRTSGMMINAAVMGLIAPLRYVLLTDALLESVTRPELEAVMAHEIGHVCRRHLPWMVLCLMATLWVSGTVIEQPLMLIASARSHVHGGPADLGLESIGATMQLIIIAGELALGLTLFGWVSRRLERQADTFAVQHLSGLGLPEAAGSWISRESVDAMQGALGAIARLNAVRPDRASWRHGSIAWRQQYLESLVGRRLDSLPIDRQVKWIKAAAGLVLALAAAQVLLEHRAASADDGPHQGSETLSVKLPESMIRRPSP